MFANFDFITQLQEVCPSTTFMLLQMRVEKKPKRSTKGQWKIHLCKDSKEYHIMEVCIPWQVFVQTQNPVELHDIGVYERFCKPELNKLLWLVVSNEAMKPERQKLIYNLR